MSTIGHPLSDLSNLLSPFALAPGSSIGSLASRANPAFAASAQTPGLPSRSQCLEWYSESAGWDPRSEAAWGDCFGLFRNSVIMQGIAARYALGQASSAKAQEYAAQMNPFGEFAWTMIDRLKTLQTPKAAKAAKL